MDIRLRDIFGNQGSGDDETPPEGPTSEGPTPRPPGEANAIGWGGLDHNFTIRRVAGAGGPYLVMEIRQQTTTLAYPLTVPEVGNLMEWLPWALPEMCEADGGGEDDDGPDPAD